MGFLTGPPLVLCRLLRKGVMGKRLTATVLAIGLAATMASAQPREARRYYPRAALEQACPAAVIECLVDERGRLDCTTTHEAPLAAVLAMQP